MLAECERAHFEADLLVREPAAESEGARVVLVGAGAPLGDQVVQVTAAVLPRPAVEGPHRSSRGVLEVEDDPE